jgi:hypothetical protein
MKKTMVTLLFCLILSSCHEKTRTLHVFIPEGYTGWVDLQFGVDSSKNHMLNSGDDMYVIFLSGNNLKNYKIKEKNFPGGPYNEYFYYYSKDTLYQIYSGLTSGSVKSLAGICCQGASGYNGSMQHFYVKKDRSKSMPKEDRIDP